MGTLTRIQFAKSILLVWLVVGTADNWVNPAINWFIVIGSTVSFKQVQRLAIEKTFAAASSRSLDLLCSWLSHEAQCTNSKTATAVLFLGKTMKRKWDSVGTYPSLRGLWTSNISWIDDESIVRHCKPSGSVGSGWCFNETRSTTCSQMLHERMKTTGFARLGSSFTWHGAEGPHVCAQQPTNHTTPSHTPHWAPKHSCSLFNFTWDLVSELVQKTTGNAPGRANPVFVQHCKLRALSL